MARLAAPELPAEVPSDGGGPGPSAPSSGRTPAAERALAIVTAAVVVACCAYVLWQLHPSLLLRDTTANGGDMGAHVWFPAFVRDHLLPHWRLSGWSMDWYAGFPAGQFYFPLPAVVIALASHAIPYDVAFKLVTVAGPVGLPAAAYVFARGTRLPRLAAPLAPVFAVAFLYFKGDPGRSVFAQNAAFNQGIMGGNLRSTLAGEFSFTLALTLALCFFGVLCVALRERRHLALAAALLAAVVLCHLVVGIYAIAGAGVYWLLGRPRRTLPVVAAIGAVAALLTAIWTVPLMATYGYTSSMRYEKLTAFRAYLVPGYFWWLLLLAGVAVVGALGRRSRPVFALIAITAIFGVVFCVWPESSAWNLRFLPFWYLGLYLLAAVGTAELVRLGALGAARLARAPDDPIVLAGASCALVVVIALGALMQVQRTRGFLVFWADWNYSGYQDTRPAGADHRPKAWAEFSDLLRTMDRLPPGRATWEGGSAIDAYGTPLALELLPYFTHGRIASMEGLYFESSATTPYHFMAVATLSGPGNASDPVRGLRYRNIGDFDLGVRYLGLLGVRYYLAYSTAAKQAAASNPGLRLVARVPDLDGKPPDGWDVYEVAGATTVSPMPYEPVVATGMRSRRSSACFGPPAPLTGVNDPSLSPWECTAGPWWNTEADLDRPLAAAGPPSWARVPAGRAATAPRTPLPPVVVSDVRTTEDTIRFHVDRTGVPVMVKTSYFPDWDARGADGPWRVTPNFMAVVPTSHDVELAYVRRSWDWAGIAGSLAGLAGLAGLAVWGLRRRRGGAGPPGAAGTMSTLPSFPAEPSPRR